MFPFILAVLGGSPTVYVVQGCDPHSSGPAAEQTTVLQERGLPARLESSDSRESVCSTRERLRARLDSAYDEFYQNRFDRAERLLAPVAYPDDFARDPRIVDVRREGLVLMGWIAMSKGSQSGALHAFEQAVALDPTWLPPPDEFPPPVVHAFEEKTRRKREMLKRPSPHGTLLLLVGRPSEPSAVRLHCGEHRVDLQSYGEAIIGVLAAHGMTPSAQTEIAPRPQQNEVREMRPWVLRAAVGPALLQTQAQRRDFERVGTVARISLGMSDLGPRRTPWVSVLAHYNLAVFRSAANRGAASTWQGVLGGKLSPPFSRHVVPFVGAGFGLGATGTRLGWSSLVHAGLELRVSRFSAEVSWHHAHVALRGEPSPRYHGFTLGVGIAMGR